MDRSPQGWTLDTLAKHLTDKIADVEARTKERFDLSKQAIDSALAAAEKAITAAMAAAEKAVTKAEIAAEKRFDSVNEFRAAMKDQTASFADKVQTDFRLASVEKKIENSSGRSEGIGQFWGWIVAGVGIVVGITMVLTRFIR